MNDRLPPKHRPYRPQTLAKHVSDDPQHFIFRPPQFFFSGFRSLFAYDTAFRIHHQVGFVQAPGGSAAGSAPHLLVLNIENLFLWPPPFAAAWIPAQQGGQTTVFPEGTDPIPAVSSAAQGTPPAPALTRRCFSEMVHFYRYF